MKTTETIIKMIGSINSIATPLFGKVSFWKNNSCGEIRITSSLNRAIETIRLRSTMGKKLTRLIFLGESNIPRPIPKKEARRTKFEKYPTNLMFAGI